MHEISQWDCESKEMSKSENLEPVIWILFIEEYQTWNCPKEIKNEIASQIIYTD
jgi:hypothetical protein